MRWSRRSTSCTGATVQLNDIPRYIFYHEEEAGERQEPWPMPEHMGLQEAVRRYEKGLIVRALEQSRTVTEAAEKLRLTPAGTSIQDDEVPSQRIGL